MIDTIELYLHQAMTKHRWVWDSLVKDDEGLLYEDKHLTRVVSQKKRSKLSTGGYKEVIRLHTRHIPSSHYNIIMICDPINDSIKFNFSIPKYFYGTNILQSVENVNEYSFSYLSKSWDYQQKILYSRLEKYIKAFFDIEFYGYNLDFNDVQITRIDLCYNQFFKTKELALQYLEHQKMFRKKNQRDTSNTANFETSKMFYNQNYSAKVYHKGTEYANCDLKEHKKINKEFKKKIFDTDLLQEVSDKILRYEVSIRNRQLSYLYNNKIFRKNSKVFQILNTAFNKIKAGKLLVNYEDYEKKLSQIAVFLESKIIFNYHKGAFSYLYDMKYKQLGLDNKKDYKPEQVYLVLEWFFNKWQTLVTSTRKFWFSLDSESEERYIFDRKKCTNMFETFQHCKFGKLILSECVNFLHQYIKDMQVKQKESIFTYLERIENYNYMVQRNNDIFKGLKKPKKLLQKNKLTLLLTSLSFYKFDDLPKVLQLESRTWQRYKADLKCIGIEKNVLFTSEDWDIPLDYQQYYEITDALKYRLFVTNKSAKIFF